MAGLDDRLEVGEILLQAQHRWLRPAEVCEIIRSHTRLRLSDQPANMPPGGSLFLFNKKRLRNFRKDGHNWRKKKDGKTVTEGNEKLKVGNVDVLHCYYAHGEENKNFQRRIYSMLEGDLSNIVLVHYREVKSIRTSFNHVKDMEEVVPYSNETEELAPTPEMQNSISSSSNPSDFLMHSEAIEAASLNTAQASEFKNAKSDIQQMYLQAKHRWLHPKEIFEILQNYEKYHISSGHANTAPGGSLFLFNKKQLRNFRKDGHNWRKKKDGKTVTEGNEKLKVGNVNVLHCYYAHGEENKNFQRRIYSMLEEDLSNIVLVHYREVKGNNTNFNHVKETEEVVPYSKEIEMKNSVSSSFNPSNYQMRSHATDATSLSSTQALEFEDAGSSDIWQILLEAKRRWLRPAEICGILRNYKNHHISSEPLRKPPGGSLFLFDRKVLRYIRKDGHNWRKKKDGKTVKEAHERLKAGSIYVLHCYYAHGEDNENFQRRIYWMLEEDLSHIGLVHYREVKGNRTNFNHVKETEVVPYSNGAEEIAHQSEMKNSVSSSFSPRSYQMHSQAADATSLGTAQASEFDNAESGPFVMDSDKQNDLQFHLSNTDKLKRNDIIEGKADHPSAIKPLFGFNDGLKKLGSFDRCLSKELEDVDVKPLLGFNDGLKKFDSFDRWISKELEDLDVKPLLGFNDGLKKLDSFDRLSKELEDVDERQMQSSSGAYWVTVESENEIDESSGPLQVLLDSYMLAPSLSHDQLFSIVDFSPNWAYENSEIKVLIRGKFLKSQHAESCKWSCMFGEVEVPAVVIADGVLRCYTPIHKAGRVPFYVTCSNRLACSEVREFEYWVAQIQDVDSKDYYSDCSNETLSMHFGKLLSLSSTSPNCDSASTAENSELTAKITSLLKNDNDEWDKMLQLMLDEDFSLERVEDQLLQQLLKEKLHAWLLQKLAAGGKGPSVLDEGGHGVLHFGAALGYDWVLLPTITAGVSINFRDVNGWTALHWAAFCGRERTVASLISLGAAPGALTDPTTKYASGETPADLASEQGHKGIAGYLAESAFSAQLETLNLDFKDGNSAEISGTKAVSSSSRDGELTDGLSLRDSLTAVCNATQAAARIHQVFRVQSFQRKQLKEYDGDKFGLSNERVLSLIAVKSNKAGKRDEHVDAAAVRIQNKFRSWKCRKDNLIIRQRIVKIQAHVRGHQVRKNYRKIVWSVGIVDKIILRWRRQGSGLRGFKPEPITEGPSMQVSSTKDDDYDLLKEGRKQIEERLQKALARVKSMVQYPEARDQYHRLLNVVTEIQETKSCRDVVTEIQETKVTLVDVENGSLQKKAMEINCLSDSISTSASSTFKSQQENFVKVDMKSFDPANGLNELSENRIGVLHDRVMGKLNSQIGVFTLKVLRPTYDCELLSFIFAKCTLPDDQSYILVKTNTNFLTRHMVWSLQPYGWLGGDVIDVFAEYLWLGSSKHHFYFPTLFSQKVDIDIGGRSKTDMDPTEFAKCTRKVFGLKKFDEHISQCKKIFVPLHDVNHWYLLVVHIDSQVAEIWDSLNPTAGRFNRCQHVLKALDILYDKVEFQLQKENKFSDYVLSEPVQCPRQVGGSDCGVYVVRHMQRYGKEWWHQFDSQEQRMDLAIKLVRNTFNLAWKDVLADMNESTRAKKTTSDGTAAKHTKTK